MNPEAQQIAIAESRGYKLKWQNIGGGLLLNIKPQGHSWEVWSAPLEWMQTKKAKLMQQSPMCDYDSINRPPDYLNDLNAMQEVEKSLTTPQYWRYLEVLSNTVIINHVDLVADRASATAAQRAEAFLRTLNLYKP